MIDSLRAVAVGQGGKIITTTNGGVNWNVMQTGSAVELWSVDFPSDSTGYAIGSNVVLKTTNGGLTFAEEQAGNMPEGFTLYQNFPNPFNPKTIINYQLPANNFVKLAVYDVTGKEVAVLVNEVLQTGTYKVTFDGSGLTSGVYFYSLHAGEYTDTKRMVMIK